MCLQRFIIIIVLLIDTAILIQLACWLSGHSVKELFERVHLSVVVADTETTAAFTH